MKDFLIPSKKRESKYFALALFFFFEGEVGAQLRLFMYLCFDNNEGV